MKTALISGLNLICKVAKHESLSKAAQSMHLTTGAVSQQLLLIEQSLGFSVFERHSRGIRLSERGRDLVENIEPHLQAIEQHVHQVTQPQEHKQVRLKLTPSFAFKWLVPRLEQFQRLHPDIQIHTFAEGALVDSESHDFDIAIDYGSFPYRNKHAELLMEEYLLPVMSEGYQRRHPEISDLNNATLLHDAMPWRGADKDQEWRYWLQAQGMNIACRRGHFFNRTDMAMSAAEAGVGVALARLALIGSELDTGQLVSPFEPISANAGYFILTHRENDSIRLFKQWLHQQASAMTSL
ncbi:LysR substrate-binding domain-containing protein [Vibrio sp. TRT 21S02]|uniref:LysR substrate-binding domain-containing protein n=1 Tax=Vibrio sp. TRT 21S02 TaxID=3418507 RepID=UPI003CF5E2BE